MRSEDGIDGPAATYEYGPARPQRRRTCVDPMRRRSARSKLAMRAVQELGKSWEGYGTGMLFAGARQESEGIGSEV